MLKSNTHRNPYLQHSYNKYGKEMITYIPYLECPKEELDQKEAEVVSMADKDLLMNLGAIGKAFRVSEETKNKMSEKAKLRTPRVGWNHTDESKKKMSEYRIGKPDSEEVRKKKSVNSSNRKSFKVISTIKELSASGLSNSEVARQLKISRRTVAQYIKKEPGEPLPDSIEGTNLTHLNLDENGSFVKRISATIAAL